MFSASNPETEHLLQRGLSVRILPEVKLCTTIIDKDIVWYGAINALGYATEEDNVIKVVDNKLANELLEVLLTSKILCETLIPQHYSLTLFISA